MNETNPKNSNSDQTSETGSTKPDDTLDTILRDNRPLPPARIGIRTIAFLLDFILILAIGSLIASKFVLPQAHPEFVSELKKYNATVQAWMKQENLESWGELFQAYRNQTTGKYPEPSRYIHEGTTLILETLVLCFWLYFALSETFLAGSVGKRACRLRTISTVTLEPPSIISNIFRGGIKTAAVFFFFPFIITITLAAVFFNRQRQMGHDLLARTAVIDEKFLTN